jgi:hypothetical protein
MNKLILFLIVFGLIFFIQINEVNAAWWSSQWRYRRNITITLSGEPYTRNFEPVEIFVNASSWTNKPYNDSIRIINKPCGDDTGVEIPSAVYNITQTNGVINSFTVAFEANTTSQNTVYCMYYDTSSKGQPNYPNFIQVDWSNYQIANKYLKLDVRGAEVSTYGGKLWINFTPPITSQTFPTDYNFMLGFYANGNYYLKPEYSYVKYQNPVFVRVVVYYNTTGTSYLNATIDLWANSKDIILGREFGIVANTNPTYKMLPYNDVDLPGGTWSAGAYEDRNGNIQTSFNGGPVTMKWVFDWVTFSSPRQNAGLCFVQPDYANTSFISGGRFWSGHDDGFYLVAGAVNTKARFIYRVTNSNDYTLCQDAFRRFTNISTYSIGAEETAIQVYERSLGISFTLPVQFNRSTTSERYSSVSISTVTDFFRNVNYGRDIFTSISMLVEFYRKIMPDFCFDLGLKDYIFCVIGGKVYILPIAYK